MLTSITDWVKSEKDWKIDDWSQRFGAVLAFLLPGFLFQLAWNHALVHVAPLPLINYWMALGLLFMGKSVCGGWCHKTVNVRIQRIQE